MHHINQILACDLAWAKIRYPCMYVAIAKILLYKNEEIHACIQNLLHAGVSMQQTHMQDRAG